MASAEEQDLLHPMLLRTFTHFSQMEGVAIRGMVSSSAFFDESTGLCTFNLPVLLTTFSLPWDLDPRVLPVLHSIEGRERIRTDLTDSVVQYELESSRCLPHCWDLPFYWTMLQETENGMEWLPVDFEKGKALEACYISTEMETSLPGWPDAVADLTSGTIRDASGRVFKIERVQVPLLVTLKNSTQDGGSSLFSAVSMALWGINDRSGILHEAVRKSFANPKADGMLQCRYWLELSRLGLFKGHSLVAWKEAKSSPSTTPSLYLFALANIVQRPIVVYSNEIIPIVGGLYLPFLWRDANEQFPGEFVPALKNPILLAFSQLQQSFHALLPVHSDDSFRDPLMALRVPLVTASGSYLPLHYASNNEIDHYELLTSLAMKTELPSPLGVQEGLMRQFLIPSCPEGTLSFSPHVVPAVGSGSILPPIVARLEIEPLPLELEALSTRRTKEPSD